MTIEEKFDVSFVAKLTSEEKQIQQNYRPIIGVHKWFARRPGALFRSLLLSEFGNGKPLCEEYFDAHNFSGITIADPFMGGGTSLFEANRVGCNVLGFDINSMSFWVVRQELATVDRRALRNEAMRIIEAVGRTTKGFYRTSCVRCHRPATVKYFLWVKQQACGSCAGPVDLFPGYLVAGNVRHPNHVLYCPHCEQLVEIASLDEPETKCPTCRKGFVWLHGTAKRNRYTCPSCEHVGKYPTGASEAGPPRHRLFGMEYHCAYCREEHKGRFFKTADADDIRRFASAAKHLAAVEHRIPSEFIPDGDETRRLHRWGYSKYREMFNDRQLFSLGLLSEHISHVQDPQLRHSLATVFSDFLRYQNMLCRYDTYSLKCQDIFSVHGFPVGLVQCENNVLGIPRIGSGGFLHFVEKYDRAKAYCDAPFETVKQARRKMIVPIRGEKIAASFVQSPKSLQGGRRAFIQAGSIEQCRLRKGSVDAVFTDPPYFDNVQYAELMDFCYVWLKRLLQEVPEFQDCSTRSERELTGNATTGKGLAHFTEGLSRVYSAAAAALKPGAPLAFTYHHNQADAYAPVITAILNAGLNCTAAIPCPAEMSASLHINGTSSSVVDTIFVCRAHARIEKGMLSKGSLMEWLTAQASALAKGAVQCTRGDLRCMALGFIAKNVANHLAGRWDQSSAIEKQLAIVTDAMGNLVNSTAAELAVGEVLTCVDEGSSSELLQARLFD